MGMFGGSKPMGYYTGQVAPREALGLGMTVDPTMAGMASRPSGGGMFGNSGNFGGLSKKQILLGGLMDAIGSFAGKQPSFIPQVMQQQQQDRQDEREDERWQSRMDLERENKLNTPQVVPLGDGGVGTFSGANGLEILREPTPDAPDWEEYANTFGPKGSEPWLKAAREAMLKGNAPEILGAKLQNSLALKQAIPGSASAGGGGGGPSITPTARAKYIAEAQAAISRGADPAKVNARLQQMGVQ